jgi:hypothetical protein
VKCGDPCQKPFDPAEHLKRCGVENGGQPVPGEPVGVDAEEAAAGPGEGERPKKVLATIINM